MSAATAAFLGSGRRMRATVAPPTTVNRAFREQRNLIQLQTLVRRPWHLQRANALNRFAIVARLMLVLSPMEEMVGSGGSALS